MLGSIFGEKLYLLLPFWLYFSLHVGSMEMSLRRHCGLFEAVLGSLGLQKPAKNCRVFKVFWKCWFLDLWSSLWLSWVHLGPFSCRSGHKTIPEKALILVQTTTKNVSKKWPRFGSENDPGGLTQNTWFWGPKCIRILSRTISKTQKQSRNP